MVVTTAVFVTLVLQRKCQHIINNHVYMLVVVASVSLVISMFIQRYYFNDMNILSFTFWSNLAPTVLSAIPMFQTTFPLSATCILLVLGHSSSTICATIMSIISLTVISLFSIVLIQLIMNLLTQLINKDWRESRSDVPVDNASHTELDRLANKNCVKK